MVAVKEREFERGGTSETVIACDVLVVEENVGSMASMVTVRCHNSSLTNSRLGEVSEGHRITIVLGHATRTCAWGSVTKVTVVLSSVWR